MKALEAKQTGKSERRKSNISLKKTLEVAFWGAVLWGALRIICKYFYFTPYGISVFARPFLGQTKETVTSMVAGFFLFLLLTVLVSLFYSVVMSRIKIRWLGLVYGTVLLLIFGSLLRMDRWDIDTLSTELAWFLSYGLFLGLTFNNERYDEE